MHTVKTIAAAASVAAATFAFVATAIAATPIAPITPNLTPTITLPGPLNFPNGTPNDGVACRTAPNAYNASLQGNTFFCKRVKTVTQALACTEQRFPTKVVRVPGIAGDTTNGKDVCLAPGRFLSSNDALTGLVLNQDYKFVEAGPSQVPNIVATQRQNEATQMQLALTEVDAKVMNSSVAVNAGVGGEDRLAATVEFATFGKPVSLVLVGQR